MRTKREILAPDNQLQVATVPGACRKHNRTAVSDILLGSIPVVALKHLSVLALPLALAGCLQRGLPLDRGIEATSPAGAVDAPLPNQFRVVTFNVHEEPGDVIANAFRADRSLRDADLIVLEEVHRDDRS